MTLLHGFPSSSHDWAKIAPALAERYALTMPDLLGFGASTKPHEHHYSLLEQADLVEALWASEAIKSTVVVAHDYSVSVAQELLTRRAAGALAVDLRALHFMNGGIYPDLHRPQPAQVALLDTEEGPQISAAMNGEVFMAGLAPTFPEGYDSAADVASIWQSFHLHNGQKNAHLLIRYIEDRRENADRWTQVLQTTDVPLTFVWGMLDPVSGAHMAERILSGSRTHRSRRWRTLRIGRRSRHRSAWWPRYWAGGPRNLVSPGSSVVPVKAVARGGASFSGWTRQRPHGIGHWDRYHLRSYHLAAARKSGSAQAVLEWS